MEVMVRKWFAEILRFKAKSGDDSGVDQNEIRLVKCRGCDTLFERKSTQKRVWCSGKCYQKNKRKRRNFKDIACDICGKIFTPNKYNQKRCGHICRLIYKRHYFHKRAETRVYVRKSKLNIKRCEFCQIQFEAVPKHRQYCTIECKNLSRARRRRTSVEFKIQAPSLRAVTEKDIKSSAYSEAIREYQKKGKKIIKFPTIEHESPDVYIDMIGADNDGLNDDLNNFNAKRNRERKI